MLYTEEEIIFEKVNAEELRSFGFPEEEIPFAIQIIRGAGEHLPEKPDADLWDCLFDTAMNEVMKGLFLRSEVFLCMKTGRECPDFVLQSWKKMTGNQG